MRSRLPVLAGFTALAAMAACHSKHAGGGITAIFDVPRAGVAGDFYALPFPNDVRVDSNGTISLAGHPSPLPITGVFLDAIDQNQAGFGLTSPVFFLFDAALVEPLVDGSVYLVDIDPASPQKGTLIPSATQFQTGNRLAIRPAAGVVLREGTTYAAVVTKRCGATRRSADFNVVLGDAPSSSPELEAARAVYAPLRSWLDEAGGDQRSDVVSAAVFTTGTPTDVLTRARAVVRALPAPIASGVLLVNQFTGLSVWEGAYDAPNFQTGTVPYLSSGGQIVLGSSGAPVVQRTESMRFALSVPSGATPPSGWPIVVYQHGLGGDYRSFVNDGTAARLAAQGLAVISTDEVLHGARNPGGNPVADVLNLNNPYALRDNLRQGAIDDFSLVRLAEGLAFAGSSGTISFNPAKVEFMGHSLGGNTGALALAAETDITGAVLSGAGGGFVTGVLHRTQPADLSALLAQMAGGATVDEFDPIMGILQMWLDPADPASYARLIATNVLQTEGIGDHYTPNASVDLLAIALQLDQVTPVIVPVSGSPLPPPVTGNHAGITSVLAQYQPLAGEDGLFVALDVPAAQTQTASFLGTLAASGSATVVVP